MNIVVRIFITLSVLVPAFASAEVIINEIAWMGTGVSSNDEWIELFNNSSETISLDGWELKDVHKLSVVLEGAVGPGEFFLLERTDDESVPNIAADVIYTGALPNSGTTLSLYDDSGLLKDRVVGGESWERIGGNNQTKETAQYAEGGWHTATATPKAKNATEGTVSGGSKDIMLCIGEKPTAESQKNEEATQNEENSDDSKKSEKDNRTVRIYEPAVLDVSAGEDKRVATHNTLVLEAEGSGLPQNQLQSVRYSWNLGDGTLKEGRKITHKYMHEGDYAVTLEAMYSKQSAKDSMLVSVRDIAVAIDAVTHDVIRIANKTEEELDLSRWSLRVGTRIFVLPENTRVKPQSTLTLPHSVTGLSFAPYGVALLRQDGSVASVFEEAAPEQGSEADSSEKPAVVLPEPVFVPEEQKASSSEREATTTLRDQLAAAALSRGESTTSKQSSFLWMLALGLLLGIGVFGVLLIRRGDVESSG